MVDANTKYQLNIGKHLDKKSEKSVTEEQTENKVKTYSPLWRAGRGL